MNNNTEQQKESLIRNLEFNKKFVTHQDGYTYFLEDFDRPPLSSRELRWIADEIDRKNKEWEEVMNSCPNLDKEDW